MKKINVVKENRDFSNIINKGRFVKDKNLIIYSLPNELNKARFGISVGTKIGKANVRNNFKRKLRNIVDINKNSYSKSKDYIIIIRKNCLETDFLDIKKSYDILFSKINSCEKENYEKK